MGNYVASNNAESTLVGSITLSSTTLSVQVADATHFPVVNNGGIGTDYSMLTLQDAANNIEIVKITRHDSGSSSFTVVRSQEGTTARAWNTGDYVACRLTAGVVNDSFVAASTAGASAAAAASSSSAAQSAATTAVATANTAKTTADAASASASSALTAAAAAVVAAYPVGSIYLSTVSTNPAQLFGFGTWVAFGVGRVLIGAGGGFTAGATGGSADATVPAHTHTFGATTGGQSASHTHSGSTNPAGSHNHTTQWVDYSGGGGSGLRDPVNPTTGDYYIPTSAAPDHTHGFSTGGPSSDHTHNVSGTTDSTGSPATGANLQPYIVVYMWNRTA